MPKKGEHTMNEIQKLYKKIFPYTRNFINVEERREIQRLLQKIIVENEWTEKEILTFIKNKIEISYILLSEIGLGKSALISYLFVDVVESGEISSDILEKTFDIQINTILKGLKQVKQIYDKNVSITSDNFTNLLLSMAEDMRVILIITANRLHTMRNLEHYNEEEQQFIARESAYLYAPLAHRMGLYNIKTELEDLSLKYTNREIYKGIAKKLNETKRSRDKYIKEFIEPLKEKMKQVGFPFEIKGRTKSIHSIYNKIKKQNTQFENIYDLFAIRIIFDTPIEKEKSACWQAYSIVTDMYQPNPKRLRDWLSIPKTNGYESLHTTVLGPQKKWVEVQIRTNRMNEVAEKGLAAHWRYKGIKGESEIDNWLKNLREILENPTMNAVDFMDDFKLDLYDEEVFVFTPNGDLHKLPKGATILDFAFSIHTKLGSQCVGGIVNGKHKQIKYPLHNGDQVEVLTSQTQKPSYDWLNLVVTSKARNKIRQSLKEQEYKEAEIGRETLIRRFKNWKIELNEGKISQLTKKQGYKTVSDFYQALAQEKLDILDIKDKYLEQENREKNYSPQVKTADNFNKEIDSIPEELDKEKQDVLEIGNSLKNIDYTLAKCCNPVFGDKIFGFVSVSGGIKVHRNNCPNAPQMISRYGYRIIQARWTGKSSGTQYPITLQVTGRDDVGIVANITSLISKEKDIVLRSISINSNSGLFQGNLTIMVTSNQELERVIKLIKNVKGVKNISRS